MTTPDDLSGLHEPGDPTDPIAVAEARITGLLNLTEAFTHTSISRTVALDNATTARRVLGELLGAGWTPPRSAS